MQLALLAAGTALMVYGKVREGQLAAAQGKAQKDIAYYNAEQLERQAKSRQEAAAVEDARISRQARIFKGEQRAKMGASGISAESGSPLELLADTAYQFSLDRSLNLRAGLLEANYLKGQANIQRAEGKWAYRYGKEVRTQSYIKAGATILMGASGAAGSVGAGAAGAGGSVGGGGGQATSSGMEGSSGAFYGRGG